MTKWYSYLGTLKFSSPSKAIATRVFLDQGVLTPGAVVFFFSSMAALEGKPDQALPRLESAYVPTLLRNWSVREISGKRLCFFLSLGSCALTCGFIVYRGVFVPVQLLNFGVVPPQFRFLVVSVASLFWSESIGLVSSFSIFI